MIFATGFKQKMKDGGDVVDDVCFGGTTRVNTEPISSC